MRKRRLIVAAGCAFVALGPSAALAAPKQDPNFSIVFHDCSDPSFDGPITVTPGDANWTPGFQHGMVLLPVSFGPFTGIATGPDGSEPINDPPMTQNTHKGGNLPRVTCEFDVSGSDGPFTFEGTGSVTFAVAGR